MRRLLFAFGLFTYFYLKAELLFTDTIAEKLGENIGTLYYGLFCVVAAVGYFISYPLGRALKKPSLRRNVFYALGLSGALAAFSLCVIPTATIGIVSLFVMLTAGIVGGTLLGRISAELGNLPNVGILMCIPYAAAFVLQYLADNLLPLLGFAAEQIHYTLITAAYILAVLLPKNPMQGLSIYEVRAFSPHEPQNAGTRSSRKLIASIFISGVLVFSLYGLFDSIIMTLHEGDVLNVIGYERLFSIPGFFTASLLFDYRGGRHFRFSVIVAFMFAIVGLFMFSTVETYSIALSCLYVSGAWMSVYSLPMFVKIAAQSGRPELWAAYGRGVKYAIGGIFALAGSFVFSHFSLLVVSIAYIVILGALAVLFYFQNAMTTIHLDSSALEQASFVNLVEEFGFTARETETLRLLLRGMSTVDIAAQMVITEHSVQKYISAMMAKTSTSSRTSLLAKFASAE